MHAVLLKSDRKMDISSKRTYDTLHCIQNECTAYVLTPQFCTYAVVACRTSDALGG